MPSTPLPWQIEGETVTAVTDFLFLGSKITEGGDCSQEIRRWLLLGRKAMTNLVCWKQRHYTVTKVRIVKAMVFPVVTYSVESYKEGRVPKNWCLQSVVLQKTPESPLGWKEIKPVNLKRNPPWILIEKTDAESEALVFWSSDANNWLIGKVPDAGKDWGQKEKRVSEDEMAGWHHRCNGHEVGQTPGDGQGQGGPVCCSPWGCKELYTTGWLNINKRSCISPCYFISN